MIIFILIWPEREQELLIPIFCVADNMETPIYCDLRLERGLKVFVRAQAWA